MPEKRDNQSVSIEHKLVPYCNQIIIAILFVIIIAVPLYLDTQLHNVFNLSKITILYVLTFTMLAIWSIKSLITCRQFRPEYAVEGSDTHVPFTHSYVQQLLKQPLSLPIVAFLFVSGLATFFSINPYISLVGNYSRYGGLLSTFVYTSLFFVIVNFVDKRRFSLLLNIIISTACIASIYGILQHFGMDFHHWNISSGDRVFSTFGNPGFFSAFLTMIIPLILIKIFRDSHLRYSTFLYMVILILIIVSFYFTKTRASFLGFIISNLFFFPLIGKENLLAHKTKTIITITIMISISVFFNIDGKTSVVGRFKENVKPGIEDQLRDTKPIRTVLYMTGLKIIRDYPILGIGPDTLEMIYPQYRLKTYKDKGEYKYNNQKTADRIHNDFLDVAVSVGLLGLGVYLWFIFSYARMVWKGYRKANNSDKLLIIGFCAGCLAYFVQNQFSFGHISTITPFWFLIAMSVIVCPTRYSLSNGTGALSFGKFAKCTFCGIIVCLMALLIVLSLIRYKADLYFENGRRLLYKKEISEAIQNYEMAVKYNPLALNYRNVLNRLYMKLAVIGNSEDLKGITNEQTRVLITNAITGAEGVQKLCPEDFHSAFTLGQAYYFFEKMSGEDTSKNTIKYYKKAIMVRPFKLEFRNKLAQFYAEKGRFKDAVSELQEAINISPDNQEAYLILAEVYMNDNEKYKEAESVLLEFIKENPDRVMIDVHRLLNDIYANTAKWDDVLGQSRKIIQLDRKDLNAHKYAVLANLKLKRYDDARNYCNRILDLSGPQDDSYSKYAKEVLDRLSEK